ncbi:MAG: ribose 5-phosphate isomerase B, partial [Acidimicrobiia bacterium]
MRIVIGSDHAGYLLKQELQNRLGGEGFSVIDVGTHSTDPVDYPDYAALVARAVVDGRADRGIVVCGSGAGAEIAANKVKGIRCVQAQDTYTARQAVEHDDANLMALGARVIGEELAWNIVQAFTGAEFSGEERHLRRLRKIAD